MSEFTPRLEAPGYDNEWWIHTSCGGKNSCILIEGNSVLPNCFAGETEVITNLGILPIKECVGKQLQVYSADHRWHDAIFNEYGQQQLYEVVLGKSTYYCTANHRWPVFTAKNKFKEFVTTDQLRPEMYIRYAMASNVQYDDDIEGIRHGFVFGDGCVGYKGRYTNALICGYKREFMPDYFEGMKRYIYNDGTIDIPYQLARGKELPKLDEDKCYLYNFLRGYFAADGSIDAEGSTINITCKHKETLETVRSMFAILGIRTGKIHTALTNGYTGLAEMSELSLHKTCLTPEFFLNPRHRERFELKRKKMICETRVKSVKLVDRIETVYCAEEPVTHTFTLGGYELTGNCVGFAFGRFSEILGEIATLSRGDAGTWFGYTQDGYERGSTPRVGAVMCFAKPRAAGHVCIVEEVHDDGSVTTSESGYGSSRFWTGTRYPNYDNGAYIFQGFIYNPKADDGTSSGPSDGSGSGTPGSSQPTVVANKLSDFIKCVVEQLGKDSEWARTQCGLTGSSAWSAAFVTACAKSTGGLIDKILPNTTSCSAIARDGVKQELGSWHKGPGQGESFTPGQGDIICFRWVAKTRSDEYECDAVGVVRQISPDKVYVIQGDVAGIVMLKFYNIGSSCISGYYRPKWEAVGAKSGQTGNILTLYPEQSTRNDALVREIGYLDTSYQPSIQSSNIHLSLINYTNLLSDLFDYVTMSQPDATTSSSSGSSADNSNVSTDGVDNTKARITIDFMIDKGLNAAASCGIAANIQRESNFNTAAVGDNGTSFGICQWHLGRGQAMKLMAGDGWATNLSGQLEYLWSELDGGYSYVLDGLKDVPNNLEGAKQATDIFVRKFEVPANVDNESAIRQTYAEEFWSGVVVQ